MTAANNFISARSSYRCRRCPTSIEARLTPPRSAFVIGRARFTSHNRPEQE
jgi:hypothetical protein